MIPKIIHYCWFGQSELPEYAKHCIETWHIHMPDYKIKRWDETNIDINSLCGYAKSAYKTGNYSYVSDIVRLEILKKYGGVYLDVDVELFKSLDPLVKMGNYIGIDTQYNNYETPNLKTINLGIGCAFEPNNNFINIMIKQFRYKIFIQYSDFWQDLDNIIFMSTEYFKDKGIDLFSPNIQYIDDIIIYPMDYLCPKGWGETQIKKTENTFSNHLFTSNWGPNITRNKEYKYET